MTSPVLQNLLNLLKTYGPILLQWLIASGIIKLPGGGTLPPLPALPSEAQLAGTLDPAVEKQLDIAVELDHPKFATAIREAMGCHADTLA